MLPTTSGVYFPPPPSPNVIGSNVQIPEYPELQIYNPNTSEPEIIDYIEVDTLERLF